MVTPAVSQLHSRKSAAYSTPIQRPFWLRTTDFHIPQGYQGRSPCLVSARLIDQMGGLQGCRVFKIAGVRTLIKKHSPASSFERTEAITVIGNNDPATYAPRFDRYKSLFIE